MRILDPRIRIYSEPAVKDYVNFVSRFNEINDISTAAVEQMRGWIIKGIEFFKVGTYRGQEYTEQHLDEMVQNFAALKQAGLFEPVFKKDHSESVDDQIGWIANVYREGEILKGDLHVTEWMAMDKIESKTWKYVSSEIYPPELAAEEFGDKVSGHVLRGLAIVSVPKVKGLKGIVLNSEIIDQGGNIVDKEKLLAMLAKHGITFSEQEAAELTEEQLEAKLSAKFAEMQSTGGAGASNGVVAAAQAAGLQAFGENQFVVMSRDDFSAVVQRAAGAEKEKLDLFAEIADLKKESKGQKIERKLGALIAAGKVTPAEKADHVAFAEQLDGAAFENYFAMLEKRVAVVEFGEGNGGQQGGSSDDDEQAFTAFQEMNKKKTYE